MIYFILFYLNVLGWMWQLWQPSANYKGSKDTLRSDLQANTWPTFLFKNKCHHKKQEEGCKEIQV